MADKPGIEATDTLLAVTSTSFDIHLLEILLPLVSGAKMVVAAKEATLSAAKIGELINTHDVSMMQATPATWKMLLEAKWQPQAKFKVLCGGEALSKSLAMDLVANEHIQLWNMYGPTETTIWSSTTQILPQDEQILLGQPIANTQFYVVNNGTSLSPEGVPGELLIGGNGLARGYLGKDELTAQQFIANPFADAQSQSSRLYRTGDLVRWLPDGQLEYLGRIDHQVKIRGFRIELGEVQAHVLAFDGIKDAVVVTQKSADGTDSLACFFVAQTNPSSEASSELINQLREHLYQVMPGYMVPSFFIPLEKMPLTPNGKIDVKALPEQSVNSAAQYVEPQTETEKILAELWQEVLNVERVGLTDNFFLLGGHSLLAMNLLNLLKDKFGLDLAVNLFFELPDLQSFAAYIETSNSLSVATEESSSNDETIIMENFKI